MDINAFVSHLRSGGDRLVLSADDQQCSYAELTALVDMFKRTLQAEQLEHKAILLSADYGKESLALLLALWQTNNLVALTKTQDEGQIAALCEVLGCQFILSPLPSDSFSIRHRDSKTVPDNVTAFLKRKEPGFIIFSSGTTGQPKGVIHAIAPFFDKYLDVHNCGKLLAFLLFDHMGGVVTTLHALAQLGTLVLPNQRTPHEVGRCVETFKVNTLHLSPTMLNLMCNANSFSTYDFSSLRHIDFGSEPMLSSVLDKLRQALPDVTICHTYGMSEFGLLMGSGAHRDQTWLKIDAEYDARIHNGVLEIKGPTVMQSYLDKPGNFTADGYLITEDLAEIRDGYLRITGRRSDIINVGGKNVYPSVVEKALLSVDNIADVMVYGEDNPMLGQLVAACCYLHSPEPLSALKAKIFAELKQVLSAEQIPRVISISEKPLITGRFKKARSPEKIMTH
jgi:long-chain acyl-CoA synthetase